MSAFDRLLPMLEEKVGAGTMPLMLKMYNGYPSDDAKLGALVHTLHDNYGVSRDALSLAGVPEHLLPTAAPPTPAAPAPVITAPTAPPMTRPPEQPALAPVQQQQPAAPEPSTTSTTKRPPRFWVPDAIFDQGLDASHIVIFAFYCRTAGKSMQCWPSLETTAKACRVKRHTVVEGNRELEARGMLTRRRRFQRSTVYVLLPPEQWHPSSVPMGTTAEVSQTAASSVPNGQQ